MLCWGAYLVYLGTSTLTGLLNKTYNKYECKHTVKYNSQREQKKP